MAADDTEFVCDLRDKKLYVYEITADYRPKGSCRHPVYYEFAHSKKEAKEKYLRRMPWMNVYKIEKLTSMDRIREAFARGYARSIWVPKMLKHTKDDK